MIANSFQSMANVELDWLFVQFSSFVLILIKNSLHRNIDINCSLWRLIWIQATVSQRWIHRSNGIERFFHFDPKTECTPNYKWTCTTNGVFSLLLHLMPTFDRFWCCQLFENETGSHLIDTSMFRHYEMWKLSPIVAMSQWVHYNFFAFFLLDCNGRLS